MSLCNVNEIPQEIEESEKYLEKIISCQKGIKDISRFLYDKLSVHVQGLSSLGVLSQEYVPRIFRSSCPNFPTKYGWRSQENRPMWYGKSMSCWTQSKEKCEVSEAVKTQVPIRKLPNPGSNSSRSIHTANALFTTERKEFQFRCVYCNGEH